MTTSLHDRLADLAEGAPLGGPDPGLWDRGRRIARRRRVGTAVIVGVTVLALGVLGTTSWWRSGRDPVPAGPTKGLRLPDRFFDPDPHLRAVGRPLGPLVAVIGAQRTDWLGRDDGGLVGVSGRTGEYRFLDLPGWMGSEEPELSADGRWLAYWYGDGEHYDGVAVYDAAADETDRYPVESAHGLDPRPLLWVGDELWFDVWKWATEPHQTGQGTEQASEATGATVRWDAATGERREEKSTSTTRAILAGHVSGGGLVSGVGRQLRVWDLPPVGPGRRLTTDVPVGDVSLMSPDQGRIAAIEDLDPSGSDSGKRARLMMLTVAGPGRLSGAAVPDATTNELLGWRDPTHVVVFDHADGTYWSVDVVTGAHERLSSASPSPWFPRTIVAGDAWAAPTYVAPEPPHPLPPLLVWGLCFGTVVAGVVALLLWRRRVRP